MEKISKEVAEKEVQSWLDFKRVDEAKIEDTKEVIEALVAGIVAGYLRLDKKTFIFTHQLKFPAGNEENGVKELTYKPRLKMSEIEAKSQNQKGTGTHKILRSYICALTNQNSAIISELDTEDNRIATSIATFFL